MTVRFLILISVLLVSPFPFSHIEVLHGGASPSPPGQEASLHSERRRAAQTARPAAWRAMGSSPCAWFRPLENADHSLNVALTVQRLHHFGFTCAAFPIEDRPPNDWSSFQKLLRACQAAGINLWAVLIPPTEGGNSHPYDTHYVKWFQVLARLSLKYPHLRGVNIDDLLVDSNSKLFTHSYLSRLYQAKQKINPRLLFVPTVYDLDPGEADRLAGCVDGVWLWWMNLERGLGLQAFLEDARVVVGRRFPVYSGVYGDSASWHREGEPKAVTFRVSLEDACQYSDGAIVWQLSLNPSDPLLQIVRKFVGGGSAKLAGKCGEAEMN